MSALLDAAKAYLGVESDPVFACDAVEAGAVRRYAQAIMDDDPAYGSACDANARYGGPVAPPLFPSHLIRRPFGTPDPVQLNAHDADYDGTGSGSFQGLPEIVPLRSLALLNAGVDVELYRHARHGERVQLTSRYADLSEKESAKGLMIFVVIESDYRSEAGELLLRVRRTLIRRPA